MKKVELTNDNGCTRDRKSSEPGSLRFTLAFKEGLSHGTTRHGIFKSSKHKIVIDWYGHNWTNTETV